MRKPLALIATLLVAGGALSACGDDDEPTATTDVAPAEVGAEDGGDGGRTVTVAIGDFVFDPTPVELTAGDSIVWENAHTQAHTATGNGDLDWNTGNLAAGDTSEPVTFAEPGTYSYICALHPFMEGTVEVAA